VLLDRGIDVAHLVPTGVTSGAKAVAARAFDLGVLFVDPLIERDQRTRESAPSLVGTSHPPVTAEFGV
jgi:hypothetical protein